MQDIRSRKLGKNATKPTQYCGIDKDKNGGMTNIGKIIRDAWLFGVIDESQTCEGWTLQQLDNLLDQVNDQWDKYGCMVSNLPPELGKKHQELYQKAMQQAKQAGWSGEVEMQHEEEIPEEDLMKMKNL